jgi:hypothetical protein
MRAICGAFFVVRVGSAVRVSESTLVAMTSPLRSRMSPRGAGTVTGWVLALRAMAA